MASRLKVGLMLMGIVMSSISIPDNRVPKDDEGYRPTGHIFKTT